MRDPVLSDSLSVSSAELEPIFLVQQTDSDFAVEPERLAVSDWASALSWSGDEAGLVTELQSRL